MRRKLALKINRMANELDKSNSRCAELQEDAEAAMTAAHYGAAAMIFLENTDPEGVPVAAPGEGGAPRPQGWRWRLPGAREPGPSRSRSSR